MKRILLLLVILGTVSFTVVPDSGIKVTINHIENSKGHILVSLFSSKDGFPDDPEKAVRKARLTIHNNQAWVLFTGLPPGNYAVAILHDENDDGRMNKNFFGLPTEGYGFSNNVMGTFGPPSFSKASFYFNNNSVTETSIKTKY